MAHKEKKEVIVIIPARGGSKGIPRKNIIDLYGKPLIYYSIQVALKSKLITRVIVSTDDEEISEVSKKYGAEVPFIRPKELSDDHANLNDVIEHTIKYLDEKGCSSDVIGIMFPTHPFRSVGLIDELLQKLLDGCTMVFTMREIEVDATGFTIMGDDGRLIPVFNNPDDYGSYFRNYGMFTAYNRIPGPKTSGFHIHRLSDPISLIDIDTYEDLAIAEKVLQHNLFDFGIL